MTSWPIPDSPERKSASKLTFFLSSDDAQARNLARHFWASLPVLDKLLQPRRDPSHGAAQTRAPVEPERLR